VYDRHNLVGALVQPLPGGADGNALYHPKNGSCGAENGASAQNRFGF
jgi:hypothetical protein